MHCWHCGRETESKERIGFRDHCPGCDRPLHVCRNCQFYDPSYHNQCREPQAEMVADKERANFCDYFAQSQRAPAPARQSGSPARDKLEALFKKK